MNVPITLESQRSIGTDAQELLSSTWTSECQPRGSTTTHLELTHPLGSPNLARGNSHLQRSRQCLAQCLAYNKQLQTFSSSESHFAAKPTVEETVAAHLEHEGTSSIHSEAIFAATFMSHILGTQNANTWSLGMWPCSPPLGSWKDGFQPLVPQRLKP